jgi:hypothetical protein
MRVRLEVEGEPGVAPLHVFCKTRRPDSPIDAEAIGRAEVDFYSRVAPLTPDGLLPRCFEAATEGGWRLVLEDLSDLHDIVSQWPLPPTVEQIDRILGAHARFHAFWWDIQPSADPSAPSSTQAVSTASWPSFPPSSPLS